MYLMITINTNLIHATDKTCLYIFLVNLCSEICLNEEKKLSNRRILISNIISITYMGNAVFSRYSF
ncbi:hypothetical protein NQ315_010839 [Exocentrus adspersus]|uniref:Uncharacterized protein n=1 Tax=Exocentrus adspersus TaxID=1586481 RepID=A0AAV8V7H1_9CUCU|nr:hypothetical protein NQ315_010839 [Exocentrus adspersus]